MADKKSETSSKKEELSLTDTIKDTILFPIHPEGWKFIGIFAVATLLLGLVDETLLIFGAILTFWCVFFFRNPERITPVKEGLVISPAFGKVCDISYDADIPEELSILKDTNEKYTRVSIFLSVFDVHVNRIPIGGKIIKKIYRPGKFLNAATDKASTDNEMAGLVIETTLKKNKKPRYVGVCQIAGWVARRIVTTVEQGQDVKTGQELGIIRFGSRADIYLPEGIAPKVIVGQRTVEGETIIADFSSKEEPLIGEKRGAGANNT